MRNLHQTAEDTRLIISNTLSTLSMDSLKDTQAMVDHNIEVEHHHKEATEAHPTIREGLLLVEEDRPAGATTFALTTTTKEAVADNLQPVERTRT